MDKVSCFIKGLEQQPSLNKRLLFILLIVLFIPHWIGSYYNIQNSIAPDLLLRTIGSRLMEAGKPIYEYKWKPADPVSWLNPYTDTRVGLNGVVSTPFVLWLLQPLSKLSYCSIRNIWGFTQEIFLFGTMWFCCCTFQQRFTQLVFIIISSLFFVYDRNWLLNLYNGQMYVIYAFFFALSYYLAIRFKNRKNIIALYTLASLIRPFFITAIIPFFRIRKQYLNYFAALAAVCVLILFLTTTLNEWKQYSSAMSLYAKEQTGGLAMDTISPRLYWQYADDCTKTRQAAFTVFGAGCLYSLQHYLYLVGIPVSNLLVFQVILALSFLLILYIAHKKDWSKNILKKLLLSFLFYQLCELITPASRNPYNMVQWLPAVAWMIAFGNKRLVWLILAGLCLNHDIPFWFKYEREIGEICLFISLIMFLFRKNPVISL